MCNRKSKRKTAAFLPLLFFTLHRKEIIMKKHLVRSEGLEPSRISPPASETDASAIPPRAHIKEEYHLSFAAGIFSSRSYWFSSSLTPLSFFFF